MMRYRRCRYEMSSDNGRRACVTNCTFWLRFRLAKLISPRYPRLPQIRRRVRRGRCAVSEVPAGPGGRVLMGPGWAEAASGARGREELGSRSSRAGRDGRVALARS